MSLLLVALLTQFGCSSPPNNSILASGPVGQSALEAVPMGSIPQQSPDPLSDQTRADICTTDALLLSKYPIRQLENTGWTQFCCGADPVYEDGRCELDWPSSDVPDCSVWDAMRNQVYARHGYPFTGEKWSRWASAQPWYERREDFSEDWLSTVARANIETLKRYAKTRHNCG